MISGAIIRTYNEALYALVANELDDPAEVIKLLTNDDGLFIIDEGPLHDYKDEYPFSISDAYFGGILRLICAFHNSYGGVIFFGVHDKTRAAGKNSVNVDSEKVNRKLREELSSPLTIRTAEVETKSGRVQILIVPPRGDMIPPIYVKKKIGAYEAQVVYLRQGAEVLAAKGENLSFLYGERKTAFSDQDPSDLSVPSSLPPSPATIQEFVGRFSAIEKIIKWLTESRDPRLFLWGQGGSGKSTIAYEFATLLAQSGGKLRNKEGKTLDRILYISGKATYLDTHSGKIREITSRDFDNATDIYRAILLLANWTDSEIIEGYTEEQLLDALRELFDIEAQLIVIDDIDTLTTSNKDAGMEELLLLLSRASSGTKCLYTQRNFPSFAPNASFEIPGLSDGEFQQFLALCCAKFSTPFPSDNEAARVKDQSEGRPLAIETMIGMRRVTSSYDEAFRRWKENSSEARSYLFNREYQQLNRDGRSRHLLAALSIFQTPQSTGTLLSILQFSPEQLEDAIAETRDMFLKVESGGSPDGDLYSIGAATRLFINESSEQLDLFASIKARVQIFLSRAKGTPAAFIPFIGRAERSIIAGHPEDAISLITKRDFPPAFFEHPDVQSLLGQAYASLSNPNVSEARKCFESAFTAGQRNHRMYIDWLNLEKENQTEFLNGIAICNKVISSSGFSAITKASFQKRLAKYQALRARDIELTSPEESARLRLECVLNNVGAYLAARDARDQHLLLYKERADDSISIFLRTALKVDNYDFFFDLVEEIFKIQNSINEFSSTFSGRISELLTRRSEFSKLIIQRLNRLRGKVDKISPATMDKERRAELLAAINATLKTLSDR